MKSCIAVLASLSGGLACRFQPRRAWRQNLQQRPQVPFIFAPAAERTREQRLAHLPSARGRHRPLGLMEVEAGGLPIETQEFDQAPALALQIRNQSFVVDRQHA